VTESKIAYGSSTKKGKTPRFPLKKIYQPIFTGCQANMHSLEYQLASWSLLVLTGEEEDNATFFTN